MKVLAGTEWNHLNMIFWAFSLCESEDHQATIWNHFGTNFTKVPKL